MDPYLISLYQQSFQLNPSHFSFLFLIYSFIPSMLKIKDFQHKTQREFIFIQHEKDLLNPKPFFAFLNLHNSVLSSSELNLFD